MLLTEHLQRNPTYEKGQGRPLPAQGTQLANLTTVKLSRKKMSENLRPNVCGKYALQGSSRALYTLLYPTTNNAPDLYHFTRLGVLCLFEVEQSRMVVCWADLIWCSGVTMVWCSRWCMVWSVVRSETRLIVWCGGLIWGGSFYGLLMRSGSMV